MRDHGGTGRTRRFTDLGELGGLGDQSLKAAGGVIALQFNRFVDAFGAQQILANGEAGLDRAAIDVDQPRSLRPPVPAKTSPSARWSWSPGRRAVMRRSRPMPPSLARASQCRRGFGSGTPAGVLGADLAPTTGADFLAAAAGLTLFEVSDGAAALGASDLAFAVGFFVAMSRLLVQTLCCDATLKISFNSAYCQLNCCSAIILV